MYTFNKITVNPQLPSRISRLTELSYNLWWVWNTELLSLFREMDSELWEHSRKNPVKFLNDISQEVLEQCATDAKFLKKYDEIVENFDLYINSKSTWFTKNYPDHKDNLIAYFSAEYGLDEVVPIYSGGLGILSGDHCKSASDLGLPFVAIGLLYKNGYFHQKINTHGVQETEYKDITVEDLPIFPVKDENGEDLYIYIRFGRTEVYLRIWEIKIGRVALYLLDSDNDKNNPEFREVTRTLYGGDQEMRIRQEIILGMGGTNLLRTLKLEPNIYHMNEGHSAFMTLELIRDLMETKQMSFDIAKDIVTSKTVFTTHTPVPAGNDIFPIALMEKYFKEFWPRLGLSREDFLKLGTKTESLDVGFNMGILALKIAGKKNGVSELHGAVSRELFGDVWPSIAANESPITYVTNGIHTCTWLASDMKELYNKYLIPYWQDNIHLQSTWEKVDDIPDEKLWEVTGTQKQKMLEMIRTNVTTRLTNNGIDYKTIQEITGGLKKKALTIGFARRFATYKRATLIFKNLERITKILNDERKPVQLVFAGKAHPRDVEGQEFIKYIHEISMMPQFKGKVFLLDNYNMAVARLLVSGVDMWLNTPRRPMEASGTSGQKAAVNGVVNFSILDGWWAEGYNGKNGWAIGTNAEYSSYEEQDNADSESIYDTLENEIIPKFFNRTKADGVPHEWMRVMKESIKSTVSEYSTSRMLIDYIQNLYMPLIDVTKEHFSNLDDVMEYNEWKKRIRNAWHDITIKQNDNVNDITINAGNTIKVGCTVQLTDIDINNITVQVYSGKILDNGIIENVSIIEMNLVESDDKKKKYVYEADLQLNRSGQYGYTFRIMPKHPMLLDSANMDLIKWITD